MDDHVGKPFRQEALLSTIDRWSSGGAGKALTSSIDRAVYDEMQSTIGQQRMVGLLAMLADELTKRFGPSSLTHDRDQVAEDAHAMVSAASMIGFASLAALCREVEMVCRSANDYQPLLDSLRARSSETIAEIALLRAA